MKRALEPRLSTLMGPLAAILWKPSGQDEQTSQVQSPVVLHHIASSLQVYLAPRTPLPLARARQNKKYPKRPPRKHGTKCPKGTWFHFHACAHPPSLQTSSCCLCDPPQTPPQITPPLPSIRKTPFLASDTSSPSLTPNKKNVFRFEPESSNSKNINLRKKWGFCRFQKERLNVRIRFRPHPQSQISLVRISVCNQVSNGNSY